jgi:probable rRNA maturation factor
MRASTPPLASRRSALRIDIVRESRQWRDRRLDGVIRRAAEAALKAGGTPVRDAAEIGVLLTDDNGIRGLNRAWRGIDKPTNVLSFPAATRGTGSKAPHLGDVALAYETVHMEATDEDKDFTNHLAHLVVHGVLHLLGYDHAADDDATDMELREITALALLGIADPYADRELVALKRAKA